MLRNCYETPLACYHDDGDGDGNGDVDGDGDVNSSGSAVYGTGVAFTWVALKVQSVDFLDVQTSG